ncbi:hypothetical protein A2U01_0098766, partial [Trifolium medium]|nr:hypothetical protein [Trifolium medium]
MIIQAFSSSNMCGRPQQETSSNVMLMPAYMTAKGKRVWDGVLEIFVDSSSWEEALGFLEDALLMK